MVVIYGRLLFQGAMGPVVVQDKEVIAGVAAS